MVWFAISPIGNTRPDIVKGNLKQVRFHDIINRHLLPKLLEWFLGIDSIFMNGGAPSHANKSIKTQLDNHDMTSGLAWK